MVFQSLTIQLEEERTERAKTLQFEERERIVFQSTKKMSNFAGILMMPAEFM